MFALRVSAATSNGLQNAAPVPPLANQLLTLVNAERAAAGLTALKLDVLACSVAENHAIEMARHEFLSHWGLDGRKPYHRYAFAGGTEAIQENGGSIDHSTPVLPEEIAPDLIAMHKSMHDEVPPNDGHRKTILGPWHTHVGFGYAGHGYSVRLCEIYVARYLKIDPYPQIAPPGAKFKFSGQLLDRNYSIEGIEVHYEPLPSPPAIAWLRVLRPYGLPEERETLHPKLGPDLNYEDGSKGSIEMLGRGRFQAPIVLTRKQPGIYTIVVWIQRLQSDTPFPATQVCLRAG